MVVLFPLWALVLCLFFGSLLGLFDFASGEAVAVCAPRRFNSERVVGCSADAHRCAVCILVAKQFFSALCFCTFAPTMLVVTCAAHEEPSGAACRRLGRGQPAGRFGGGPIRCGRRKWLVERFGHCSCVVFSARDGVCAAVSCLRRVPSLRFPSRSAGKGYLS